MVDCIENSQCCERMSYQSVQRNNLSIILDIITTRRRSVSNLDCLPFLLISPKFNLTNMQEVVHSKWHILKQIFSTTKSDPVIFFLAKFLIIFFPNKQYGFGRKSFLKNVPFVMSLIIGIFSAVFWLLVMFSRKDSLVVLLYNSWLPLASLTGKYLQGYIWPCVCDTILTEQAQRGKVGKKRKEKRREVKWREVKRSEVKKGEVKWREVKKGKERKWNKKRRNKK